MNARRALLLSGLSFLAVCRAPINLAWALDPLADDLIAAVNKTREAQHLSPVRAEASLCRAAQAHAEDLARRGVLDHAGRDGSELGERLAAAGFRWHAAVENLARGSEVAGEIVELWLNSSPHRRNLLRSDLDQAGVGVALSAAGAFWVLDLARS